VTPVTENDALVWVRSNALSDFYVSCSWHC